MERVLPAHLIPPGLPDVVYPTAGNHEHDASEGYWSQPTASYEYGAAGYQNSSMAIGAGDGVGTGGPDMDASSTSTWADSHSHSPPSHSHSHSQPYFSHPQALSQSSSWSTPHSQMNMDDTGTYSSMDVGYGIDEGVGQDGGMQADVATGYAAVGYNAGYDEINYTVRYSFQYYTLYRYSRSTKLTPVTSPLVLVSSAQNADPQLYYSQFPSPTSHYHAEYYAQPQPPPLSQSQSPPPRTDHHHFSASDPHDSSTGISPQPQPQPQSQSHPTTDAQPFQSPSSGYRHQQQGQEWYTNSLAAGMPIEYSGSSSSSSSAGASSYTTHVPKLEAFAMREPMGTGTGTGRYYAQEEGRFFPEREREYEHQISGYSQPDTIISPSTTATAAAISHTVTDNDDDLSSYFGSVHARSEAHPLRLSPAYQPSQSSQQALSQYAAHPASQMYATLVQDTDMNTDTDAVMDMGTGTGMSAGMDMGVTIPPKIVLSPSSELSGALDESAVLSKGKGRSAGMAKMTAQGPRIESERVAVASLSLDMGSTSSIPVSAPVSSIDTLYTTSPLTASSSSFHKSIPKSKMPPKAKEAKGKGKEVKEPRKIKTPKRSPTPVMDFLEPPEEEVVMDEDSDGEDGDEAGGKGLERNARVREGSTSASTTSSGSGVSIDAGTFPPSSSSAVATPTTTASTIASHVYHHHSLAGHIPTPRQRRPTRDFPHPTKQARKRRLRLPLPPPGPIPSRIFRGSPHCPHRNTTSRYHDTTSVAPHPRAAHPRTLIVAMPMLVLMRMSRRMRVRRSTCDDVLRRLQPRDGGDIERRTRMVRCRRRGRRGRDPRV